MIPRAVSAGKRAFGLSPMGRNAVVFPDDTFVVSFPESGSTRTCLLVANLLHPEEPASDSDIDCRIPEWESLTRRQIGRMARPRIMRSHQHFDPRFPRVIYLVRDPRIVALSQYRLLKKRGSIGAECTIDSFVTPFVAGDASVCGSWKQHVSSWIATRYGLPGFLLLRYEDMVAHTVHELARIAGFLGIAATPESLSTVAAQSSALNTTASPDSVEWNTGLSQGSIAEIESAWAPLMVWLGYDLATRRPGAAEVQEPLAAFGGVSR
jgi:hypothetical protein